MKILGLDIGSKRIGVAVSDALGMMAHGRPTIRRENDKEVIDELKELISNESIEKIVIGLPLNMDGSHGPQAEGATAFAKVLEDSLKIPVKLWDERMTTMQVERVMIEAGASRMKRKRKIDKLAAQVILQSYLDAHRDKNV